MQQYFKILHKENIHIPLYNLQTTADIHDQALIYKVLESKKREKHQQMNKASNVTANVEMKESLESTLWGQKYWKRRKIMHFIDDRFQTVVSFW